MLAGTLRENLDPFAQRDDATLHNALRSAGMWDVAQTQAQAHTVGVDGQPDSEGLVVTLDTHVESGGANFSLGQRYEKTRKYIQC